MRIASTLLPGLTRVVTRFVELLRPGLPAAQRIGYDTSPAAAPDSGTPPLPAAGPPAIVAAILPLRIACSPHIGDDFSDRLDMRADDATNRARLREQARCQRIMAQGQHTPGLAAAIAFKTSMPRGEAVAFLAHVHAAHLRDRRA